MKHQAKKLAKIASDSYNNDRLKSKTKIICISSANGGIGKSTLSIILSYFLSNLKKILLVDGDIYFGNIDLIIKNNFSHIDKFIKYNILDTVKNTINNNSFKMNEFEIISSSLDNEILSYTPEFLFDKLTSNIRNECKFDYIFIDCGALNNKYSDIFIQNCDKSIIVLSDNKNSIRSAVIHMNNLKASQCFLILNKIKNEHSRDEILKLVDEEKEKRTLDIEIIYLGCIFDTKNNFDKENKQIKNSLQEITKNFLSYWAQNE